MRTWFVHTYSGLRWPANEQISVLRSQTRRVPIYRSQRSERLGWPGWKVRTRNLESGARDSRRLFRPSYHAPSQTIKPYPIITAPCSCILPWFSWSLLPFDFSYVYSIFQATLRCDGINHCGDASDEQCQRPISDFKQPWVLFKTISVTPATWKKSLVQPRCEYALN